MNVSSFRSDPSYVSNHRFSRDIVISYGAMSRQAKAPVPNAYQFHLAYRSPVVCHEQSLPRHTRDHLRPAPKRVLVNSSVSCCDTRHTQPQATRGNITYGTHVPANLPTSLKMHSNHLYSSQCTQYEDPRVGEKYPSLRTASQ